MQIASLFAKDINRPINGVIKVAQDDTDTIRQELDEYVVTTELSRHFSNFFESYERSLDVPTADMGVWISGFFGSGKSHFLKMLSYLLANRVVDGVPAIDFFKGKIEDPMVESKMVRVTGIPTEVILFNIDSKGGQWKERAEAKTALLRAFARVFYEHMGFYGEDLKLARLEQFIDSRGKTEEFREAFARVNGGDWLDDRAQYNFFEDDVVEVMQEVLGMSEESARNWFNGTESDVISIDLLTDQIKSYVDARKAQNGGKFRLVFAVDEVGQFIGSDVNLMLNLQTIVEELGSKCQSDVWVMVTSQEAIDDITKVAGNDFSKIQGRFATRLSLSSSSVDEVIKRRVLDKKDSAREMLKDEYEQQSSVLKNLFTFEDSQGDLKGYAGPVDFEQSYPFVNYQFKIMPNVLAEIRKHGYSGKHLSSGERSMLSGFQEAAQQLQDSDTTALMPLWRFYDTITTFLEHGITQVFSRSGAAVRDNAGLLPQDVEVLKTLYLIRYIPDIKPTIGNIAILMIDDMNVDKIALREQVQASLDRLVRENYVGRNGDRYTFLTDEEQEIAREISNTTIDPSEVIEEIKKILFDGIYTAKKYRLGANDFPVDRYVDDTLYGNSQGGMKLNVITLGNAEYEGLDANTIAIKSTGQALIVLPDDERYYDALQSAARIRRYVRTKNVQQLPESTQRIIEAKQKEARANREEAKGLLAEAVGSAHVAIDGRTMTVRSTNPVDVFEEALKELVSSTFTKADYITQTVEGTSELVRILGDAESKTAAFGQMGGANDKAIDEMERFLNSQAGLHQEPSMEDIQRRFQTKPYGWREYDIAGVVARLIASGQAQAKIGGVVQSVQDAQDRQRIASALTGRNAASMAVVRRERPSDASIEKTRKVLRELDPTLTVPDDLDELVIVVRDSLTKDKEWCVLLLQEEYEKADYPQRDLVEQGAKITGDILANAADERALLAAFTKAETELLDWNEDVEGLRGFFPNQQRIFDEAAALLKSMQAESAYLESDAQAQEAMRAIREILHDAKPYRKIPSLTPLINDLKNAYEKVLTAGKHEVLDLMDSTLEQIEEYADGLDVDASQVIAQAKEELARRKGQVHSAQSRTVLDTVRVQLDTWRKNQLAKIDKLIAPAQSPSGEAVEEEPRIRTVERARLCPPRLLSSEQEIDAYVGQIREKLLDALAGSDSVSIH